MNRPTPICDKRFFNVQLDPVKSVFVIRLVTVIFIIIIGFLNRSYLEYLSVYQYKHSYFDKSTSNGYIIGSERTAKFL